MKLLRYGEVGHERPAILDSAGGIRDLSTIVADISGSVLRRDGLEKLKAIDPSSLPLVAKGVRIGPCVTGVGHFLAIGMNYADHARETGAPVPQEPIIFSKAPTCISGPDDDVIMIQGSKKTDWEVELAFVIGEPAYQVKEEDAMSVVAGFCLCNDVSEREFQLERGGQWIKGKSAPTYGPLGPWLVTPDEIADVDNLSMWLDVNGKRMQTGSTKTMIFGIKVLVAYITRFMRLLPGDVVSTGTPPGVGLAMNPPVYLREGDVMELGIDGLGRQRQVVRA